MGNRQRKPIFYTSDWHIGHANVIQFSNRPFHDVNEMSEVLIRRYNSTVPENGVCYFLGDMGWGDNDALKNVISRLNGTKVLILGNHDRGINSMYGVGFDVVMYSAKTMIGGQIVTLSHCPLPGLYREDVTGMKGATPGENWHGETKHTKTGKFVVPNEGQFHLCGHIHWFPGNTKSTKTLGRQYDVGVDANNFAPVSSSTIESWIAETLKKEKEDV